MLATASRNGEQRVRRMATGETTERSELDAEHLLARLRARGVARLADQDEVWAIVDPSELRKPYAKEMPDLMRVRALGGEGTVRGYRTLNVLGVGTGGRRGILYHHLFSSAADDFVSESRETQDALTTVGQALAAQRGQVTYVMDKQFDDIAVWATIWDQGNHLVCRLQHPDRQVEAVPGDSAPSDTPSVVSLTMLRGQLQELARVRTEMLVRKISQRFAKRQPTTVIIRACPLQVPYQVGVRTLNPGPRQTKRVWLVEVRLDNVSEEPWLLLTDWPITDETSAVRIFRMYRER